MVPDGTPSVDSAPDSQVLPLRPVEECVTALRKGSWLLKYGRYGKPKLHYFRLINHDSQLAWRSANGSRRAVDLSRVRELRRGQCTEVFRRFPQHAVTDLSFSLIYTGTDGDARSLDLICPGEETFALWFAGVQALIKGSQPTPSAVLGKALALAHTPKPPMPPANPAAAPAPGRVSGDIGLPIRSRTPGDLWIWGSPTPADRSNDGTREPGRIAAMRFREPHLLQETKQLDVLKVAVGVRHAALVTYTGDLYTWGEGKGGVLGHGHQADVATPTRVALLWGRRVVSVRCSAAATAVVTDANELLTWGDGAAGTLGYASIRQPIPRLVPLPPVALVALSQFHAAAVTEGGQLFTWGCGLGGKLGHGDTADLATPREVVALRGMRVLRVACGHWHTAAIVAPGGGVEDPGADQGHITSGGARSRLLGASGLVYSWGGMAGTPGKDQHRGCLGLGDLAGRAVPTRVPGPLQQLQAVQVVAGATFTAVVTSTHKVYQAGELVPTKGAKWSPTAVFEQVGGPLERRWTDELTAGMYHCIAAVRSMDFRSGLPVPSGARSVYAWGRGAEGQLGTGTLADSGVPVQVVGMHGRTVQQVAGGGYYSMSVCEHGSRTEDAEDLRQLQQAQDFFKQRFKESNNQGFGAALTSRTMRALPNLSHSSPPHAAPSGASSVVGSEGRSPERGVPFLHDDSADSGEEEGSAVHSVGGSAFTVASRSNSRVARSVASIANRLADRGNRKVLKNIRAQASRSMTLPAGHRPPRPPEDHPSLPMVLQRHESMPPAPSRQLSTALSSRSLASGPDSGTRSPPATLRRVASHPEPPRGLQDSISNLSLESSGRASSPGPWAGAGVSGSLEVLSMDAPTSTRSEPPPEGSLAYARAMETRMAKLERMLAHRMAENEELRARVAVLEGGERVESAHRRELSFAEMALERTSLGQAPLRRLPQVAAAGDPLSDTEEHDNVPTPRLLQSFALGVPQGPPSEASSGDDASFVSPPTSPPPQPTAGGASPGALEAAVLRAAEAGAWTEEMEEGVFLHFEQRDGGPQLVRIRFSRRRFSKAQAEAWYADNRARIAEHYSQAILDVGRDVIHFGDAT